MPYADPEERKAADQRYYQENADKIRDQKREYNAKHAVRNRKACAAYYQKNRDHLLAKARERSTGVTDEEYTRMLEAQDGRCAICTSTAPGGRRKSFCVDHCHKTGHIRGLLCNQCNVTLGKCGDNLEGVMRFAAYLQPVVQNET